MLWLPFMGILYSFSVSHMLFYAIWADCRPKANTFHPRANAARPRFWSELAVTSTACTNKFEIAETEFTAISGHYESSSLPIMNPEQVDSVYTIYSLPMAHLNTLFPVGTEQSTCTLWTPSQLGYLWVPQHHFTTEHLLLKAGKPECSK